MPSYDMLLQKLDALASILRRLGDGTTSRTAQRSYRYRAALQGWAHLGNEEVAREEVAHPVHDAEQAAKG